MLKIKKVKPMFTSIITTMDKYDKDITIGGIIDTARQQGSIKEYQRVLAVGGSVKEIKEGDLVCINPSRFAVRKHKEGSLKDGVVTDNPVTEYKFDIIELDDKPCLLLQDRDIDFIIEEFDEVPDQVPSTLIKPEEKKFIC